jgi:hypothetical protein
LCYIDCRVPVLYLGPKTTVHPPRPLQKFVLSPSGDMVRFAHAPFLALFFVSSRLLTSIFPFAFVFFLHI